MNTIPRPQTHFDVFPTQARSILITNAQRLIAAGPGRAYLYGADQLQRINVVNRHLSLKPMGEGTLLGMGEQSVWISRDNCAHFLSWDCPCLQLERTPLAIGHNGRDTVAVFTRAWELKLYRLRGGTWSRGIKRFDGQEFMCRISAMSIYHDRLYMAGPKKLFVANLKSRKKELAVFEYKSTYNVRDPIQIISLPAGLIIHTPKEIHSFRFLDTDEFLEVDDSVKKEVFSIHRCGDRLLLQHGHVQRRPAFSCSFFRFDNGFSETHGGLAISGWAPVDNSTFIYYPEDRAVFCYSSHLMQAGQFMEPNWHVSLPESAPDGYQGMTVVNGVLVMPGNDTLTWIGENEGGNRQ